LSETVSGLHLNTPVSLSGSVYLDFHLTQEPDFTPTLSLVASLTSGLSDLTACCGRANTQGDLSSATLYPVISPNESGLVVSSGWNSSIPDSGQWFRSFVELKASGVGNLARLESVCVDAFPILSGIDDGDQAGMARYWKHQTGFVASGLSSGIINAILDEYSYEYRNQMCVISNNMTTDETPSQAIFCSSGVHLGDSFIKYYLSRDCGDNWKEVQPGILTDLTTIPSGVNFRYKILASGLSSEVSVSGIGIVW
jgi:hypothetical protein